MEAFSLIFLVLVLGLRHGLDADHLACIYNWRMNTPIARWIGTFFSFGHVLVVASVAIILGVFIKGLRFPDYLQHGSVILLLLVGTLNIINLLRAKSMNHGHYQVSGIKGKFLSRLIKDTTNPLLIIFIGGLFTLAADTINQTSINFGVRSFNL